MKYWHNYISVPPSKQAARMRVYPRLPMQPCTPSLQNSSARKGREIVRLTPPRGIRLAATPQPRRSKDALLCGPIFSKNAIIEKICERKKMGEGTSSSTVRVRVKRVSNYITGKTLGRGTFGDVRLATHIITGEKVAIKILEKNKIACEDDFRRVVREIQVLKLLNHENIVRLLEVIDTPRHIYLVTEYVAGGELFNYVIRHKRLTEREAARYFHQIIIGLHYCHLRKICHRDLKLENTLLSKVVKPLFTGPGAAAAAEAAVQAAQAAHPLTNPATTEPSTAEMYRCAPLDAPEPPAPDAEYSIKIIDFGLSNILTADAARLKTACGSPSYASPEMLSGKRYSGPLIDIWASGIVLFAMVCGFLPFDDDNVERLYKKIIAGHFEVPPFVSPELADLLRRILRTNPATRIQIHEIVQHPWYLRQAVEQGLIDVARWLADPEPVCPEGAAGAAGAAGAGGPEGPGGERQPGVDMDSGAGDVPATEVNTSIIDTSAPPVSAPAPVLAPPGPPDPPAHVPTVDEIIASPELSERLATNFLRQYEIDMPKVIDFRIIYTMVDSIPEWSPKRIIKALNNNRHNQLTATYYLLCERKAQFSGRSWNIEEQRQYAAAMGFVLTPEGGLLECDFDEEEEELPKDNETQHVIKPIQQECTETDDSRAEKKHR